MDWAGIIFKLRVGVWQKGKERELMKHKIMKALTAYSWIESTRRTEWKHLVGRPWNAPPPPPSRSYVAPFRDTLTPNPNCFPIWGTILGPRYSGETKKSWPLSLSIYFDFDPLQCQVIYYLLLTCGPGIQGHSHLRSLYLVHLGSGYNDIIMMSHDATGPDPGLSI